MESNHTWSVVPLPPGKHTIGSKWVYEIKYNGSGAIDRYKARLVAKGYNQREGIDFLETFSPVAKLVTVKILLAFAAIHQFLLIQLDVNNAFLHGDLFEEVYMDLPLCYSRQGEPTSSPNKLVCQLLKSIYGLKQASRQWYSKLSSFIIQLGFQQSKSDYSLFIKGSGSTFMALLVYVDDILITGPFIQEINSVKSILHQQFKLKDLGQLKYFLGLEIAHSSTGIVLSQRNYALQLLEDNGFLSSKPAQVPMDPKVHLHTTDGEALTDILNIVGSLVAYYSSPSLGQISPSLSKN